MKKKAIIPIFILVSMLFLPGIQPYTKATIADQQIPTYDQSNQLQLIRITPSIDPNHLPSNAEIVGGQPGSYHDILIYKQSISELEQKGYEIKHLSSNDPTLLSLNSGQYHSLEDMEQSLFQIAEQYTNITSLFSIGKSYENRDIWCLELSDNPGIDEQEPGVLLIGLHHAREWPTMEIVLHIAENMTQQYNIDPEIQDLINNRRIWLIPCLNPDGYYYCHDQGHDWRKNRHYFADEQSYGVDLNRNYAGSTNADPLGMWGSTGMSHNPDSSTYCGENQFSEPETNAVKEFFISHDIHSCITWHTYSELVMWPWGYNLDTQTPNDAYMSAIGMQMASRITRQSGSGTYTPTQSAGLYPTTGDTTDWMYGYSHYVKGNTCFPYCIEACASFHPSAGVIPQVCEENMDAALYLIEETYNISQLPQRVIPPTMNEIERRDDSYYISWELSHKKIESSRYEIEELYNMYQYTDTAVVSPEGWILDGFSTSTSKSYSDLQSYQSHTDARSISVMTTQYPTYITDDLQTVSFYCCYDVAENRNNACFEISTDGRDYTVIDTYSGTSTEWEKKEYSLEPYQGKSVYFRFRYAKSSKNIEDGFYVDDITPVTIYYNQNTLTNNTQNQYYTITETDAEDYFIRIRGYNNAYGWGDFSQLYPIQQIINENTAPEKPTITGPQQPITGKPSTYNLRSIDPNNDELSYIISWGDGKTEEIGPYPSGETISVSHTWEKKGRFQLKVRAKDNYGMNSEWATLQISLNKQNEYQSILQYILSSLTFFFERINSYSTL